ncbi:MAG: inositol 2-dehydrogenase [Myxococcaceae bacterium]
MPAPLRIGVIGAGRIGIVHARTVAHRIPEARVVAIADPNLEAAKTLAASVGGPQATADYRELLSDAAIDAVAICSSTDTHAKILVEAAQAKKHVFCEKPLDLDLARIDSALAEVRKAGITLMVGFNRRFDPDFKRVREAIVAGAIGKPHLLRITSRDPNPPPPSYVKLSGGMFLDMTIHDFDMARFLFGEVLEVSVAAAVLVDPAIGAAGDVDTAIITLKFENGALGAIDNSRKAVYGYDQRVEAFGSAGMAANQNRAEHTVVVADGKGLHAPLPLNFFMQRYTEAYEAEMRAFVECVQQGQPPPVNGDDGRKAIVLGYAAKKSLAEHRPVRLSELT